MPKEGNALVAARPQPVLAAGQMAGAVGGVVSALATVAVVLGMVTQTDADSVVTAVTVAVGAIVTAVNVVLPIIQAMKARDMVTPLADPRDPSGIALVPVVDPNLVQLPTPEAAEAQAGDSPGE